jgi:MFS family permease
VVARIVRSGNLRRVLIAFVGFALAEYGVWVAILVYAYRHGGATTAGLIAAVQLAPAAVVAPVAARMTERAGAAHGLLAGYVLQAAALAGTAASMLAGGPPVLAYAAAVIAASAVTVTRPAQAALVAARVDEPDELTAATVVAGWIDSASILLGPALAGGLIATDGPGLAFAVYAAAVAGSALLIFPLTRGADRTIASESPTTAAEVVSGGGALARDRPALAVVGVIAAGFVAVGALDVLAVVLAISTLSLGASGAGYLTALDGAGGLLGGLLTLRLVGARSLLRPIVLAALVWALSYALLAAFAVLGSAIALLIVAGACRSVLDTAGRALLARITPASRLGRMFGLLEGVANAGLAVGSLLVPAFVALGGVELALGVVAAVLAASVALPSRLLRHADRVAPPAVGLRRLSAHPLFAHLPAPLLEELARDLVAVDVTAGEVVIRQGDVGDNFYLIADGEFEVSVDGEPVATLQAGDGFGEIALLRDIPRTATVETRSPARLYALAREPFLRAMAPVP